MELLERPRLPTKLFFVTVPPETPISEDGKRVSEQTYWEKYYHHPDFNYEWVNGYLEEKPVSNNATSWMYGWLVKLLEMFLEVHDIARLTRLEMGFRVPLSPKKQSIRNKKTNIRKPDLGVVVKSNPVPANPDENRYDGIFDLCIEAISYTTKKAEERDTKEKREEYEYALVKEYFILDDRKKETTFLRLNRWGIYEEIKRIDGDIIQSAVLPGFQFRVSDLYRQPTLAELVEDEVYQGFVMLKYQAEKERADTERRQKEEALRFASSQKKQKEEALLRAEQSEQEKEQQKRRAELAEQEKQEALRLAEEQKQEALRRASEAEKKAERFAAMLKQLGISLD